MAAISAHSGCLEPGCMWTFGEGIGMDTTPQKGGSCSSACPDGGPCAAASVKGPRSGVWAKMRCEPS